MVARPSLSYCCNYSPTAEFSAPGFRGYVIRLLSLEAISRRPERNKDDGNQIVKAETNLQCEGELDIV